MTRFVNIRYVSISDCLPEFIIVYTDVAELADDDVDVGGARAHGQHLHYGLASKL